MAIYRGPGGSGDATTDAQNEGTIASNKATEAAASATAAASSATDAATSASNASTSATNASTSASTAGTHATNASNSATSATSSASSASTSASAAATSETNAATSATNAATSATNAATSATNASTSETNAATSATAAATSATNAATSETNAAASYDSFDDRYLGSKTSAPTLDNDGDALLTGALYWHSTNNQLYVWDGSAWDEAAFNTTGAVLSFNTRTGAITLTSGDVTTALGYTPSTVANLNDISDVTITTPSTNQVLKYNGSAWVNDSDTDTGIQYTDLSVTTNAVGTAALSYNNTNGVFSYTPPDLSGYLTSETYTGTVTSVAATVPTGFTIAGSPITSSGTLAVSFDTGYSLPTDASQTNWNTAYSWGNHASAGYLTSFTETNNLTSAVTWANVPDANITQSSVTQHQSALSITESQISDLGTYVTKTSSTGAAVLPSGTTAQRDGSPAAGYIRFNSTTTGFEGYDGSSWGAIGGGTSTGEILQVVTVQPDTGLVSFTSTSYAEVDTDLRVAITPKASDSTLIVTCNFLFGGNNQSQMCQMKLYDITNTSNVNTSAAGSRTEANASVRFREHDANDGAMINLQAQTTSGSTVARTYGMYAKLESAATRYFFSNTSNTAALGYAKPSITVMEVSA